MSADVRKIAPAHEPDADNGGAALVLSEQVRIALRTYFARLDGYQATNLHAMVIGEVEKPLISGSKPCLTISIPSNLLLILFIHFVVSYGSNYIGILTKFL